MDKQCPIFSETVDQSVVRMTAFFTVLLLLAGLFSYLKWIALFLCFDFFIRGFTRLPLSPLHRAARAQAKLLRREPKPVDAPPKKFAVRLGFIATAIIALLAFTGLTAAARVVAEILVLMAGMEAFLGICVGCHIHTLLQPVKKAFRSTAE
ncbi:MAG: DUF4395 domain-containing protein [Kiritimatiellales bacterium]|nr:DUF4395 domain-containing protein [Kiritimatiellota bacterium]MBL7011482.1 DUF4395 domain-containing protein [Kiritimatiellales bacterium]